VSAPHACDTTCPAAGGSYFGTQASGASEGTDDVARSREPEQWPGVCCLPG
jgi:hypothetical protein